MLLLTNPSLMNTPQPQEQLFVVEFESRDIAEKWYSSDAYQALIPLRQEATENAWVVITDKFSPPS